MRKYQHVLLDNDLAAVGQTAAIPEFWAESALALLYETFVMPGLVHTDYSPELARKGDTINIRKPKAHKAGRKTGSQNKIITTQAQTESLKVDLNIHAYDSFSVGDVSENMSIKSVVAEHVLPSVQSLATHIDRVLCSQSVHWIYDSPVGSIGTAVTEQTVHAAALALDKRKVPQEGRNLAMNIDSYGGIAGSDALTDVGKSGSTAALRAAHVGQLRGVQTYKTYNMLSVEDADVSTGVTASTASTAGASTVELSAALAANAAAGMFINPGDGKVHRIVSKSGNVVTITPALSADIPIGTAVTIGLQEAVAQTSTDRDDGGDGTNSGYRAGWTGYIQATGSVVPVVGQFISFGNTGVSTADPVYVVVETDGNKFMLDRPLVSAVATTAKVNYGINMRVSLAFRRPAFTFVSRVLQTPPAGMGVQSAIARIKDPKSPGFGMALRATMHYDPSVMEYINTYDMLAGTALIYQEQGLLILE